MFFSPWAQPATAGSSDDDEPRIVEIDPEDAERFSYPPLRVDTPVPSEEPTLTESVTSARSQRRREKAPPAKEAAASDGMLNARKNSWVDLLHRPGTGTPRKSKKKFATVEVAMTKAHLARLQWESKNSEQAHEERSANDERRSERRQQHWEHARQGRVRQRAGRQSMVQIQHLTSRAEAERLEGGGELRKHLDGLKREAGRQHAAWEAEVVARAERLGSARSLRVASGSSHGVRRSRSADQLRKARVAEEGRADSSLRQQHVDDMKSLDYQQNRRSAGYRRLVDLHAVAAARTGVRERLKLIASETSAEVHRWREGKDDYEVSYLERASASKRDVERTRRRCAKARAAELSARATNAKAVRVDRKAAEVAWQCRVQQDETSKRMMHDRIAREKLA